MIFSSFLDFMEKGTAYLFFLDDCHAKSRDPAV